MFNRIKSQFRRIWWFKDEISFQIFLGAWFACIAVYISLCTVGGNDLAMSYFGIASYVFIVFAILTLIRLKMEPKDTEQIKRLLKLMGKKMGMTESEIDSAMKDKPNNKRK